MGSTKEGKDIGRGAALSGGFGSFGTDREKVSLGQRFDQDGEAVLTASRLRSEG